MAEDRSGQRGGPIPPLTLEKAMKLFAAWRTAEYGWVQALILQLACDAGEWHADMTSDLKLPEPNIIGAAVRSLAQRKMIQKVNKHGEPEFRLNQAAAAHRRGSWVWSPTLRGIDTMTKKMVHG